MQLQQFKRAYIHIGYDHDQEVKCEAPVELYGAKATDTMVHDGEEGEKEKDPLPRVGGQKLTRSLPGSLQWYLAFKQLYFAFVGFIEGNLRLNWVHANIIYGPLLN